MGGFPVWHWALLLLRLLFASEADQGNHAATKTDGADEGAEGGPPPFSLAGLL